MKKPIIRNWIKYWASTLAVSGMLVVGACDNNNQETTTADTNIPTTETVEPARENVAETTETEEMQTAETEEPVEFEQTSATPSENVATPIRNMDKHIEEHKDVNKKIKNELTDTDLENLNEEGAIEASEVEASYLERGNNVNQPDTLNQENQTGATDNTTQPGTNEQTGTVEYDTDEQGTTEMEMQNNTQTNPQDQNTQGTTDPTQQQNSLENKTEQDTTNVYDQQSNTNIEESPDAYMIIIEEYRAGYSPESQQAMDEITREYTERRESMRGQMDETTGAYASPEVDPQYQEGTQQLMQDIQENLEYPQNAAAAEIEGTVFVNFIVDEQGNITEAKAVEDVIVPVTSMEYTQPLNPTKFNEQEIEEAKEQMKEEAVKAVKETSGQWEPAQQEGQNVKAEVQLPVVFDIEQIGVQEDVPLQE